MPPGLENAKACRFFSEHLKTPHSEHTNLNSRTRAHTTQSSGVVGCWGIRSPPHRASSHSSDGLGRFHPSCHRRCRPRCHPCCQKADVEKSRGCKVLHGGSASERASQREPGSRVRLESSARRARGVAAKGELQRRGDALPPCSPTSPLLLKKNRQKDTQTTHGARGTSPLPRSRRAETREAHASCCHLVECLTTHFGCTVQPAGPR